MPCSTLLTHLSLLTSLEVRLSLHIQNKIQTLPGLPRCSGVSTLYLCPRLRCSFSCHFSEMTSFPLWLMLLPCGYLLDCLYLVIQDFSKDVTCRFPLEWQSSGFHILFSSPQNTECLLHLVLPKGQGLQEGAIRPIYFKTKCELYIWGALSSVQRNSCYCILFSDFANTLSQKYCKINLSLYITNMIIYSSLSWQFILRFCLKMKIKMMFRI